MSRCRDLEPLLTPYVDGEATAADRAVVDAHLERCPPCRDLVSGERIARDVLATRRDGLKACATQHLKQRCAACVTTPASARATAAPGGWLTRRSMLPLSMAATLLLAIGGAVFFGLTSSVEALAAQLVVDHVKCFQFAPDGRQHADAVALGQQWAATRGWHLKVPDSSATAGLQLLTVRRCASTEGLTAHLMYRWKGEPLSVYVLNSTGSGAPDRGRLVEKLGQEAVIWSERGRTYAVVARARPSELEPVVQYVRQMAE
jgi:anti-sigma factor RsiW